MPTRTHYAIWTIGVTIAGVVAGCAATATRDGARTQPPAAIASQAAPSDEKWEVEPKAVALLKATSERLAAARSLQFTAVVSYESPSRLGPPLVYTTKSEVVVQRPDRLRVITVADGPRSEFYYDGKTITAFAPKEDLAAIADAPSTIDDALKAAYDQGETYFPFTDFVVADPYGDIADGLKLAFYVGQSHVVGGTTTDIVAYASDTVFAQIWIGADDKLPRMLRAVFRRDPSRLRHHMELSGWRLDRPLAGGTFTSAAAAKAKRIGFAPPDPILPPEFKAPAKAK